MLNEKAMLAAVDTYTDEEFIDAIIDVLHRTRSHNWAEASEEFVLGATLVNLEILEHGVRAYRQKKFGSKGITTL